MSPGGGVSLERKGRCIAAFEAAHSPGVAVSALVFLFPSAASEMDLWMAASWSSYRSCAGCKLGHAKGTYDIFGG